MAITNIGTAELEIQICQTLTSQLSMLLTTEGSAAVKLISTENKDKMNEALGTILTYYNSLLTEAIAPDVTDLT